MESDVSLTALAWTAATLGFVHTIVGPDHYLPFIVMAKAGKWSKIKAAWITFLCGLGHVAGSVVLGLVGVAAGVALSSLKWAEGFRGDIAAWLLTGFGLAYCIWGIKRALRNRPHQHVHAHSGDVLHQHEHVHHTSHVHAHDLDKPVSMTPWILFTIFVFGPCEPLIPLLMYPAAKLSFWGVGLVAGVFAVVTISTMMAMVMLPLFGLSLLPTRKLERFSHALAGGAIFMCGLAIHMGF